MHALPVHHAKKSRLSCESAPSHLADLPPHRLLAALADAVPPPAILRRQRGRARATPAARAHHPRADPRDHDAAQHRARRGREQRHPQPHRLAVPADVRPADEVHKRVALAAQAHDDLVAAIVQRRHRGRRVRHDGPLGRRQRPLLGGRVPRDDERDAGELLETPTPGTGAEERGADRDGDRGGGGGSSAVGGGRGRVCAGLRRGGDRGALLLPMPPALFL
mmetsp:Transcript_37666/g.72989  ORF Transcript_37666/g.72989 Transcript_37666/m.72989 type:complete len:221 (+) Transcript_37666:51-713(+)